MRVGNWGRVRPHLDRWLICFVCAICAVFLAQPVSAQIVVMPHTAQALGFCHNDQHLYTSQTANAPSIVARSFRGQGSIVTFRVCNDADGNTHYFIREPRPNRNDICRIFEQELFPGDEQDLLIVDTLYDGTAPDRSFTMTGWKSWPPEAWAKLHYAPRSEILAQASTRACPSGDDVRYVPVGPMTDGMLNGFFKLWSEVSNSPAAFDKAFAHTISDAVVKMGFPEDNAALVVQLRSSLFDKGASRPVLEYLDCGIGNLEGCSAGFDRYVVGFDVSEHGIVITRLDPVLLI